MLIPPLATIAKAGAIVVPGPIYGVISLADILILGMVKAIRSRKYDESVPHFDVFGNIYVHFCIDFDSLVNQSTNSSVSLTNSTSVQQPASTTTYEIITIVAVIGAIVAGTIFPGADSRLLRHLQFLAKMVLPNNSRLELAWPCIQSHFRYTQYSHFDSRTT